MSSDGVAILGAGLFAKMAHLPGLVALAGSAPPLKAVYSRSEKSSSEFAASAAESLGLSAPPDVYHDTGSADVNLDALLARQDITSVIIILPITLQPSIILKALAAGKHVISEKPVGADVKRGLELIETYEREYKPKGLVWRVAENYEVEPGYLLVKKMIAEDKIGKVAFVAVRSIGHVDEGSMWYKTAWRTVPDYQGGFLLDGGVHTLAALRTMLPDPITHVAAFASLNKPILAPHDTINAILKSTSYHGVLEMTFAAPSESAARNEINITGSKGCIYITREGWDVQVAVTTGTGAKEGEREETFKEPSRGVEMELKNFFEATRGRDDGNGAPRNALADVAFIQAALTSEGRLVDLQALAEKGQ